MISGTSVPLVLALTGRLRSDYQDGMPAKRSEEQTTPDPLALAVGERIAALLEARHLIPSRLAELAGMDPNYLWRITAGRQNLSLRNIARLAVALDVTLSELFEGVSASDVDFGSRAYSRKGPTEATGDAAEGDAD